MKINVDAVDDVVVDMKVEKEASFKPSLFLMKTRDDLYGLLRGPFAKPKK